MYLCRDFRHIVKIDTTVYHIIMKKIYTTLTVLCAALSLSAQQLPNVGFEGEWVESKPWNTISGTEFSMNAALQRWAESQGEEYTGDVRDPEGWTVSNVLGIVSVIDESDGGGYGALGTTVVGAKAEGCDSESALKLTNSPNPFMATQIVPAYVSLGTSWATNALEFFQPVDKDGGIFGGLEFAYRPDALVFDYKLEAAAGAEGQKATVLVYAWKGSWSQAEVPGNNAMIGAPVTTTMIDRERNILGMEYSQGGEVTRSDDAELIAKSLEYITEFNSEWKSYTLPIEYPTASTPEKIHVVLSANDYFDSENIVSGNSLTIDNVKFAYYSRLKSLKVGGVDVEGFNSENYTYSIATELPEASAFEYEVLGNTAKVKVELDEASATATIKVTNDGEDVDGKSTHEYTIQFKKVYGGTIYTGDVKISFMGSDNIEKGVNVHIITDADDKNKCTLVLPDFSFSGAVLGDIVVENVTKTPQNGGYAYEGSAKHLALSLMGQPIVANVSFSGTSDSEGNARFIIPVVWLTDYETNPESNEGIQIDVEFNGITDTPETGINDVVVDENAPVEYFNLQGVRVANPERGGIYIRRQGTNVAKVLVK